MKLGRIAKGLLKAVWYTALTAAVFCAAITGAYMLAGTALSVPVFFGLSFAAIKIGLHKLDNPKPKYTTAQSSKDFVQRYANDMNDILSQGQLMAMGLMARPTAQSLEAARLRDEHATKVSSTFTAGIAARRQAWAEEQAEKEARRYSRRAAMDGQSAWRPRGGLSHEWNSRAGDHGESSLQRELRENGGYTQTQRMMMMGMLNETVSDAGYHPSSSSSSSWNSGSNSGSSSSSYSSNDTSSNIPTYGTPDPF